MYKAIIFDFDGTLADTMPAMYQAVNLMLGDLQYPLITKERFLTFINGTVDDFAKGAVPQEVCGNGELISQARTVYESHYSRTFCNTNQCYPGISELLKHLSQWYRLAIYSNKQQEYVDRLEEILFPKGLFETVRGSRKEIPGKPNPEGAKQLMLEIQLSPAECVYVGDSNVDYLTAVNAGFAPVNVCWGYRTEEYLRSCGVPRIAHTPKELEEILLSL